MLTPTTLSGQVRRNSMCSMKVMKMITVKIKIYLLFDSPSISQLPLDSFRDDTEDLLSTLWSNLDILSHTSISGSVAYLLQRWMWYTPCKGILIYYVIITGRERWSTTVTSDLGAKSENVRTMTKNIKEFYLKISITLSLKLLIWDCKKVALLRMLSDFKTAFLLLSVCSHFANGAGPHF